MRVRKYCLLVLLLFVFIISGCGQMNNTIVSSDTIAPTVTLTVPVHGATSVPIGNKLTATFSESMDPTTITSANFTLKHGITTASGSVTYSGFTAVFTPGSNLIANTNYTATITTGVKDLAGNVLANTKTWNFTTGAVADTTAPTVSSTIPADLDNGIAINGKVAAIFSEAMDPTSITTSTYTLKQGTSSIPCDVTYFGFVAILKPISNLSANTLYTVNITTGARDLAGNGLAADKTWNFTTGSAPDTTAPTASSVVPADLATNVAINSNVLANFSEGMDPATLTNATFTLMDGTTPVPCDVSYLETVATLNPSSNLASNTTYIALITTGAKDLAGNALSVNKLWSFTTGVSLETTTTSTTSTTTTSTSTTTTTTSTTSTTSTTTTTTTTSTTTTTLAPGAVQLNSARTYGILATTAITDAGISTINGDAGLYPGTSMAASTIVTGETHVNDSVAHQAKIDLLAAYNFATSEVANPGDYVVETVNLGAVTISGGVAGRLPPGVYSSGSTMNINTDIVLDGGGNPNAVWVFQVGSSLTTTSGNVILTNEAQAKNVFWATNAAATIGTLTTFEGTILAGGDVTANTGATINGRILAGAIGAGTLALQGNIVNVPQP